MRRSASRPYRSRTPFPDGFRMFVRGLCRLLFRVIARVQVVGRENVPASGPCILVFNHLSNFDPPLIAAVVRRADLTGLVAASYRRRPLTRLAVNSGGGIWVRRGTGDRSALRAALDILEEGFALALAPEGGRSESGALRSAKIGVAWLARRTGAPIVPIALTNTGSLRTGFRRLQRPVVGVRIGPRFELPPADEWHDLEGDDSLERSTAFVMRRIAALLPEEYRGVYGGAPDSVSEGVPGGVP